MSPFQTTAMKPMILTVPHRAASCLSPSPPRSGGLSPGAAGAASAGPPSPGGGTKKFASAAIARRCEWIDAGPKINISNLITRVDLHYCILVSVYFSYDVSGAQGNPKLFLSPGAANARAAGLPSLPGGAKGSAQVATPRRCGERYNYNIAM